MQKRKNKVESFMKGVFVLMFSQVLIKLLGLVYKMYLTNKEGFGDAGNAIYSGGYQIYALLLTISSVGVPNAISKLVSERTAVGDHKGAHRIFKIAIATFGVIGMIGTLALFLGAGYISDVILQIPEAEATLVALSPAIFFVTISSVVRGYFNGRQKMSVTAKSQTLEQIFKTVLTIVVVEIIAISAGANTAVMAAGANLATTLSTFLSLGYLYLYYRFQKGEINQEIKATVNYKPERIKNIIMKILLVSAPITLSAIMSSLNKNIDSITVVRGLKTFMDAASAKVQYGILSGKVDTLITLPLSFNIAFATALVPAVSASIAKNDINTASKRISFSMLVTMLIGLPCTVGMMLFSEQILGLLFPNAASGSLLLEISAMTILFSVLVQTANGALQGLGRVVVPAVSSLIGLIVKLILNLILIKIPSIGVNGAAIASIANNIVAFVISFYILKKTIKLNLSFSKFIIKPIIATGIMGICSYALYLILQQNASIKISTIISIAVAVIIYAVSVIVLKIFNKTELCMIPYGNKLCKVLERLGIYEKNEI